MVGKWERGFKRPSPFYQEKLCALYGLSAEQLGLVDDAEQALPAWSLDGDTLAEALESWRHDVERRAFLRHMTSVAGLAALAPTLDTVGAEPHERLARALERPSRVDDAITEHLENVINEWRRLDDRIGSRDLQGPVTGHLQLITSLLQGSPRGPVHRRLCTAAAQVAQLAGWLAFDMNDHRGAQRYYEVALRAAQEAGDRVLSAYVLGCMSVVATYGDDAHAGLQLGYEAQHRGKGWVTATTLAWLCRVEALALATLGEAAPCASALDRAEVAIAQASPASDPPWIYHFNRSQLAGQKGACYVRLHRPKDAQAALGEALTTLSTEFVRDRSLHLTHLASAYAQQGEIEEACRLAGDSWANAMHTGSARELRRIHEFRRELDRWNDSVAVKELDAQLLLS